MKDGDAPIGCVALLSGGLDSILAAALMKEQGIEVLGVFFDTGFGPIPKKNKPRIHPAETAAGEVGILLEIIDISKSYPEVLLNPAHGYGSAANPCTDCHIEMLKSAREHMQNSGARFIVTGEVMGQRPKSQKKDQLKIVAEESGTKDVLLRPLSARLLEPTLPEREGWVDRDKLFEISGRSRETQFELAERLGIKSYTTPSGGCLLTEGEFANKFFDLLDIKGKENITFADLQLLKAGRHFRLAPDLKIIVGRNEDENMFLEKHAGGKGLMEPVDHKGPVAVVDGVPEADELRKAAQIVARYGQAREKSRARLKYTKGNISQGLEVEPMEASGPERWRI